MRRREFITLLGGVAAWPCVVVAQGAKQRSVIGIFTEGTPAQRKALRFIQSFLDAMRELGYIEGRDFVMIAQTADSTGAFSTGEFPGENNRGKIQGRIAKMGQK